MLNITGHQRNASRNEKQIRLDTAYDTLLFINPKSKKTHNEVLQHTQYDGYNKNGK